MWFPYTGDDEESTASPGNADAHYFAVAKYTDGRTENLPKKSFEMLMTHRDWLVQLTALQVCGWGVYCYDFL